MSFSTTAWTRLKAIPRTHRTAISLAITLLVTLSVPLVSLTQPYAVLRERAFDLELQLLPGYGHAALVVDIDPATLAERGAWPWSRQQIANLITAIAELSPSAIGVDILLAGPDTRSPSALARALALATGAARGVPDPDTLPDGDRMLIAALTKRPVALGAALATAATRYAPPGLRSSVLVSGQPALASIWHSASASAPIDRVAAAAQGLGVLSLAGDIDGRIRRVPLLVGIGDGLAAGLAAELARLAVDAGAIILLGSDRAVQIGGQSLAIGDDAMLRLRPVPLSLHKQRTVSASDILAGKVNPGAFAGRPVLVGSSAPEAGGLRLTGTAELAASVQIHADALDQILAGDAPSRPATLPALELLLGLAAATSAVGLGRRRAPLSGLAITGAVCVLWIGIALTALRGPGVLLDPVIVPLAALLSFSASALKTGAVTWAREQALRRRFEQHLAPEVVNRIVAAPDQLRLEGQHREVSVLFTDIEGFTALVERSPPREVVGLLDSYIDCVSEIIVAHGGMIDKVVGDAVHALFNAPLDLVNHEKKAVACATAIIAGTEALRRTSAGTSLALGRTRIGIETGPLIVGDVGRRHKIDYTAHGDAINTAARLEQANKIFGSSICIGSGTARAIPVGLRPIGKLRPRGRTSEMTVYEPWPGDYTDGDQALYLGWFAARDTDGGEATLGELARRHPSDEVLLTAQRTRLG